MKILVLGGSGMAGHTISIYLKEKGHCVTVFSRRKTDFCNSINGDVTDFDTLKQIVYSEKYDAIINAVGILNLKAEENKSHSILVNSFLPYYLSDITKELNTRVIQMSTDCVFSGKHGLYKENSQKDGYTFYDRTKSLGELDNDKDLTFRNSIIGPDLNPDGIGLFNWFMKQKTPIQGYSKAIWTGVTTLTLAKAMEKALEENLTGLYHLVNNTNISKYELLKIFNKHMRDNEITILNNQSVILDKSLLNTRTDFSFRVPSYEHMVIEMKNWIEDHKELYPHYFN